MEDLLRGRRAWKGGNNCWRDLHFSRRHPSSCGVGGAEVTSGYLYHAGLIWDGPLCWDE